MAEPSLKPTDPSKQPRSLYPDLRVVTEDHERDCFLVQFSRAKTSKSFDILSAFRKTKGEWATRRGLSRLRPHSVEFLQEQVVERSSSRQRSKTSVGSTRQRLAEVDAEMVIRPLTRAQPAASRVPGSAATVHTSLSMALSLSDTRRPPTCVRGRTREKKHQPPEESLPSVAPVFEEFGQSLGHGLRTCSYPGESDTLVMARHECSMRHPEAYARWLGGLRRVMQEMESRAQSAAHSASFKNSTAGKFHDQLSMLSNEVLAAVQLHLDYVRSEIAGLCSGGAMHVVGGASAVEGFPAKYGQRRLELAMLRKHLNDEHWNLRDTAGLDSSAGATGFAVWINGLAIKRFSLRHNTQVQRAILPFFSALRNALGQVTKRQYLTFNVKVFRALVPVFDIQNAILLSEADWSVDSKSTPDFENPFINEQQFFTSMFELADNWCESPSAAEMVTWLNKLRVTLFDNEGQLLRDEHIMHDERFWFDGIDPLGPSMAQKLQSIDSRGVRNVMFQAISDQVAAQSSRNKRSALSAAATSATRPKAGYHSIGKNLGQAQDGAKRPRTQETFNVNVGGKRLSLTQTYVGSESPVRSYLNNVRVPNVWAAELKELAAAYLRQAENEHASAAEEDDSGAAHLPGLSEEFETWAGQDSEERGRSRTPAQVETISGEEDWAFQAPDADDKHIFQQIRQEFGYGHGNGKKGGLEEEDGDADEYEEAGMILRSEFFEDGEQVGDVAKLHKLHEIIYGRAQTPADIANMRSKFGFEIQPGSKEDPQESREAMAHKANWEKSERFPRVSRPTKREWDRFKSARFKEREAIYDRMRAKHKHADTNYFDNDSFQHLQKLKSFEEKWQEKENCRRREAVSHSETVRAKNLAIMKKLAEIAEVLDGSYKGTYHGAKPSTVSVSRAVRNLEGLESEDLEPEIDVSKIVEKRLTRMGMTSPQTPGHSSRLVWSGHDQRRSRPV